MKVTNEIRGFVESIETKVDSRVMVIRNKPHTWLFLLAVAAGLVAIGVVLGRIV